MRVAGVFGPADYPGVPDDATRADLATLFATLFPGVADPAFDAAHVGLAIAAHSPKMALHLAQTSRALLLDTGWGRRADLRELAILTVNLHFRCEYAVETRLPAARAAGLSEDLLADLAVGREPDRLDDEQGLVVEYARAVVAGAVPPALFARVVAAFGERGAVECTTIIAFWSAWAMILTAAGVEPIG